MILVILRGRVPKAFWEGLGRPLGGSRGGLGAVLGASWAPLGRLLGCLGRLLGRLAHLLGCLGCLLGCVGRLLGCFGASRAVFGPQYSFSGSDLRIQVFLRRTCTHFFGGAGIVLSKTFQYPFRGAFRGCCFIEDFSVPIFEGRTAGTGFSKLAGGLVPKA